MSPTIYPDPVEEEPQPEPAVRRSPQTPQAPMPAYRGATSDPAFGFLLALALSVGLIPLLPDHADLRYTLAWGILAGVGVLAWLMGNTERIGQERPENLAWGLGFALLLAGPLLLFGGTVLGRAAVLMFPEMRPGTVLAYIVFVLPLAETLFFRGILQTQLRFWIVGLLATLWHVVLYFPVMWADLLAWPAVGVMLAAVMLMMNMMFAYVRQRNGLAAAWICQIVVNMVVIFLPFL